MMFMASQGGIKAAFAQANPMIHAAGQVIERLDKQP
jgi:hypothetical protein